MPESVPLPLTPEQEIEVSVDEALAFIAWIENEYNNDYTVVARVMKSELAKRSYRPLTDEVLGIVAEVFATLGNSLQIPGNTINFDSVLQYPAIHPQGNPKVQAVLKKLFRQGIGTR